MKRQEYSGFSLAEILVTLPLMGFIVLSILMFLVPYNMSQSSIEKTYRAGLEINNLINNIQKDLHQGAYISGNSCANRLEYTTYDFNGNATKKIYRIDNSNYLQLSLDGGATWISPYSISTYNAYQLSGSPQFLFANLNNNCTLFTDTNADGIWNSASDSISPVSCDNNTNHSTLSDPSQASKLILNNFRFTGSGLPMTDRVLISPLFIDIAPGYVRSTVLPAVPAVKDPPLVQAFATSTANSLYGANFVVRGLTWDPYFQRLLIVGRHSAGSNKVFLADRDGVLMGNDMGLTTQDQNSQFDGVAVDNDHATLIALDGTANYLYRFNLNTGSVLPLNPMTSVNLSGIINNPTSVAYSPKTDNVYIVGTDPGDNKLKVFECNKISGSLSGNKWPLPAAFDTSHPPAGLAIEPATSDFLVVRNYVNGSSPNRTIDIYRIEYVTGTSTAFNINTDDLGSSATGMNGNWGIAYDPFLNRLFLSDAVTKKSV